MKIKKTSLAAILAAVVLVAGVTTAFATSGQAAAQGTGGNPVLAQNSADTFTFQGTLGMDAKNAKLIADSKWFPDYEQYGLSYDAQQGVLSYNGQLISFFHDETAPGVYTHVTFSQGTVGIEVKRNTDWEIVGLVEYSTLAADVIVQEGSREQTVLTAEAAGQEDSLEQASSTAEATGQEDSLEQASSSTDVTVQESSREQASSTADVTGQEGSREQASSTADVTGQESSREQTAVTNPTIPSADFYEPTRDELLAEYGDFGISFDVSGKMLYQNKPVRWFAEIQDLSRYILENEATAILAK